MKDIIGSIHDCGVTTFNAEKFNYKWTIKNFIFNENPRESQAFESPEFFTSNDKYKWSIEFTAGRLTWHGGQNSVNLSLKLLSESDARSDLKVKIKMSFISTTNQKTESLFESSKFHVFNSRVHHARSCTFNMTNISGFKAKSEQIYPNGNLTVLCRMILYRGNMRNSSQRINRITDQSHVETGLSNDFQLLFENKMFSDVSLVTSEMTEFSAHKSIFSARSPVFRAMFQTEMVEKKESKVKIEDCSSVVLQEMLRYIYTGKINDENMQEELFQMADKYQLSGLKLICSKVLLKNLNVQNVAKILILSDLHKDLSLRNHAINFIVENAKEVIETDDFQTIMSSYPNLRTDLFRAMS